MHIHQSNHRTLGLLAMGLFVSMTHNACNPSPAARAKHALPTAHVKAMRLAQTEHMASEEIVGTVHARLRASIEAKVSGRIKRLTVKLGQSVSKGMLLAELDVGEIQAKLAQANAMLTQAKTELERTRGLLEKQAVTQHDFDAANARYQVAQASMNEARSMLAYAQIKAPFAGVVTQKSVDVGDLASPGKALLELEEPGHMRLEVGAPEALVSKIAVGQKVPVKVDNIEQPLDGVVAEIAPSADANTRSFLIKIDLPTLQALRLGQFGRAFIPASRAEILRVPTNALVRRGQMQMVFVVEKGVARLRLVKTGRTEGQRIEVVSGLTSGDDVIIQGAQTLRDEQPVQVQ